LQHIRVISPRGMLSPPP